MGLFMDVLRKLWWGLYPLGRSFWGFYIFGGLAVMFVSMIVGALLVTKLPQLRPVVYITFLCVVWTYWAVATVGVWRSASLYTGDVSINPIAAKCVVLLVVGTFLAENPSTMDQSLVHLWSTRPRSSQNQDKLLKSLALPRGIEPLFQP
jgi:hypothetical protein